MPVGVRLPVKERRVIAQESLPAGLWALDVALGALREQEYGQGWG